MCGWVWRFWRLRVDEGVELVLVEKVVFAEGLETFEGSGCGDAVMEQFERHEGDQSGDDLQAHGLGVLGHEAFEFEVLFDPFEEQLDLPSPFVEGGDVAGRALPVFGQEDQFLGALFVVVDDAAQGLWILVLALALVADDVVLEDAVGRIDAALQGLQEQVGFGTGDEAAAGIVQLGPETGIDVGLVEDVAGLGLDRHLPSQGLVMQARRGDLEEGWALSVGVEHQVELDGGVVDPEGGPAMAPGRERDHGDVEAAQGLLGLAR